jgi:cellulose biosynthesis protein BcsQ
MSVQHMKKAPAIIVALASEKGGVGKTTLTATFLAMLSLLGYRVLGVDMDPQGQLGLLYAYHRHTILESVYTILKKFTPDVLRGERAPIRRVLKKTHYDPSGRIFDPRKPNNDGLDIVLRKVYSRDQIEDIVRNATQSLLDGLMVETTQDQGNPKAVEEAKKYASSTIWYALQKQINEAIVWAETQAYEEDEIREHVDTLIRETTQGRYTSTTWQVTQEHIDAAVWEILRERLAESHRGPDILPINAEAGEADTDLKKAHQYWGEQLRHALHPLLPHYDYIFIDCPPSIQALTINAINASNYVGIPLTPETLNLEGMLGLLGVIDQAKRRANPGLQTAGVILNKFQTNWKLHQDGARDLRSWEDRERVFNTEIKQNAMVPTSINHQSFIVLDQQESDYARAYWLLLDELLAVIGGSAAREVAEITAQIRAEDQIRREAALQKKREQEVKKRSTSIQS